jgi:hypothetical protein
VKGTNDTLAVRTPTVAATAVGGGGVKPVGDDSGDAGDGGDAPAALIATTEKLYATPLSNPFTVIGDDAPTPVRPPGVAVTVVVCVSL